MPKTEKHPAVLVSKTLKYPCLPTYSDGLAQESVSNMEYSLDFNSEETTGGKSKCLITGAIGK